MKDEYMSSNSDLRYACEEYARQTWGAKVTELNNELRSLKQHRGILKDLMDAAGFINAIDRFGTVNAEQLRTAVDLIQKGRHMDILVKANKEHPMVEDAWKRYMMALRLCIPEDN